MAVKYRGYEIDQDGEDWNIFAVRDGEDIYFTSEPSLHDAKRWCDRESAMIPIVREMVRAGDFAPLLGVR